MADPVNPGTPDTARPAQAEKAPARQGLVLTALILVAAVANLNLAVANVALPSIGTAFQSSQTTLDLIAVGYESNFLEGKSLSWVYFAATLDAAIWGAELAAGDGPGRIYVVEPTGPVDDDPNLTDKKFPGNPTLSYRSRDPLRVIAEVTKWQGHSPARLLEMKDGLARLRAEGRDVIID